jgi:hypothetical protein
MGLADAWYRYLPHHPQILVPIQVTDAHPSVARLGGRGLKPHEHV